DLRHWMSFSPERRVRSSRMAAMSTGPDGAAFVAVAVPPEEPEACGAEAVCWPLLFCDDGEELEAGAASAEALLGPSAAVALLKIEERMLPKMLIMNAPVEAAPRTRHSRPDRRYTGFRQA